MRQYLDLTTWILLFAMAPFTILVLLSQNTIPGDLFYPVKRGMENVVLAAASINPGTKVAFRTDLTERRFTEAQKLLAIRADTTAFEDFVSEVSSTQGDIANFSNQQEKIESSEKLIAEITEYQNQLFQTQTQVQIAQAINPQNIAFQTTPTSFPSSGQATPIQFTPAPTFSPIQVINQTPTPTQSPAETLQPVQATPQSTPLPSLTPNVTTEIANNPQKAEEVKQEITRTHENLEKIKEKLKEQREDAQIKEKVREEQQKFKEESKRRGENGSNNN